MTIHPLKKNATYDDLCDVPDRFIAEMFDGDLYVSPHPSIPQVYTTSALIHRVGASFDRPDPSAWIILFAPELHFGNDVLVPDVAGWRRTRLPRVPDVAYMTLAPDWICETLSPATEELDRGKKLQIYAREGVAHAWLVDPLAHTLEVMSLESGRRTLAGRYEGHGGVRAVPFDAFELDLGALWS